MKSKKLEQKRTIVAESETEDDSKIQANFRLPRWFIILVKQAAQAARVSQADIIEMCVCLYLDPSIKALDEDGKRKAAAALAELMRASDANPDELLNRAITIACASAKRGRNISRETVEFWKGLPLRGSSPK